MHGSAVLRSACAVIFGALLFMGCSTDSAPGEQAGTGSLSVDLVLAGGIEIDQVDWAITGNGMSMSGTIDVSAPGSTASVEVFGLPPGEGYLVELSAESGDDVACEGSAPFDIEAGATTDVMVTLNCKIPQRYGSVRVNGEFNICAELVKMVVSPLKTYVGNEIDVSAIGVDPEGDPIVYSWTATAGSFADPSALTTTYTCDEAGDQEITVSVTDNDEDCNMATWTVSVSCDPVPPNVVVLYTDDQGWADLGVQGATDIATPNIDQLASEGIRFTNFYAASNVCTASRAGLLTGSYPPRVDLNTVFLTPEPTGLNPEEVTIADMLKTKGYATLAIGKWHLGELPPAWPLANGFDHFLGLPYSNDIFPQPARPFTLGWPPLPLYEDSVVIDNGGGDPFGVDQHPLTSRFTERAIEFIEENSDRPFFLYLPYSQPHYPNWVGEDWMGTSGRGDYGDSVQEIDWSVGQIVQALEDNGLTENTIVLFTSDNGPWDITCEPDLFGLGGDGSCGSALPLFGWKQQTYEGGHRIPFVARWPGHIPAGSVSDELATQMDFLPTVAEIVGVDISDNPPIDGHSITDLLEDPENAQSPYDYYFYWDFSAFGNHDGGLDAVRDAEGWRLQIRDQNGNEVTELYYLPDDIGTENNIADANPDKVMELQEAAAAHEADIEANVRPRFDSRL